MTRKATINPFENSISRPVMLAVLVIGVAACSGSDEVDIDAGEDVTSDGGSFDAGTPDTGEQCLNECDEEGQSICLEDGVITCGDFDDDPCREFSEVSPCEEGTSCRGGACVAGNQPPVVNDQALETDEDTPLVFEFDASDPDLENVEVTLVSEPQSGELLVGANTVTYTPDPDFFGEDTFDVEVRDEGGLSDSGTITITVNPVNDPPVASPMTDVLNEDEDVEIELDCFDVDSTEFTVAIVGDLDGIAVGLDGLIATVTPAADVNGTRTFDYTCNDGDADSEPATVELTIEPVNDAPVVSDATATTLEDTDVEIPLVGSDVDEDLLSFEIASPPSEGSVVVDGETATFTPPADGFGDFEFTYVANDGTEDSEPGTIVVTVESVNDLPLADPQSITLDEDGSVALTLAGTDIDGPDALTCAIDTDPSNGVLSGAGCEWTYTPDVDFNGSDSFTFIVNDGEADSTPAPVDLTINPVNDRPIAAPTSATTDEDTAVALSLGGTDTDLDPLTCSLTSSPVFGSLDGADCEWTYTPNADFNGDDSFAFVVNDGVEDSEPVTVPITVTPVNDPPTALAGTAETFEDTPRDITLGFDDVDDTVVTFSITTPPAHGSLSGTGATRTYTPDPDYNGSDSFGFTVDDGEVASAEAFIDITIFPVGDEPRVLGESLTVAEDGNLEFSPTVNDADTPLTSIVLSVDTPATNGTATVLTGGVVSYVPNADYFGPDSFTLVADDGENLSPVATFDVAVTPVNDAPIGVPDSLAGLEDAPISDSLGVTDVDPGDLHTFSAGSTAPTSGGVVINLDGTFTYTPDPDFNGSDSFTYVVTDDGGLSSLETTIDLSITPVNDPPVAAPSSETTQEDSPLSANALATDVDAGDTLVFSEVTAPSHGGLVLSADGSYVYTPDPDFNGSDSFEFQVSDGTDSSAVETVSITVTPVNDRPVADDLSFSTNEDEPLLDTVSGSDIDAGDSLTFSQVTGPSSGALTLNADGSFTYAPAADFNGADSFTYVANDASEDSLPATVTLTIVPQNDPPTANDASFTVGEDGVLTDVLTGADIDAGDTLTFVEVGSPAHGSLSLNADGSFTYSPDADYNGADSFTFRTRDAALADSALATVSITVLAGNDPPLADDLSFTTAEDVVLTDVVSGSDPDVGDTLTFSIASGATNGVAVVNGDGSFTYTPAPNFHGTDTFTYLANDGSVSSSPATVTVTVTPVNDQPTAAATAFTLPEDGSVFDTLTGADVDSGDTLTFSLSSTASHGTAVVNLSGTFSYTPDPHFHGSDSFTFVVNDGSVDSAPATVSITVTPVNDPPAANAASFTLLEDGSLADTLTGTDIDAGDTLTFSIASGASHGIAAVNGDGSFTYTPDPNFHGADSFTFRVNDGTVDSSVATVSITVTPQNDPPVATPNSFTLLEDGSLADTLSGTDVDAGDTLTFALATPASHGTAVVNATGSFTYSPDPDYHGPDSFTFRVNDGTVDSPSATVSLTVTPQNDAPVALDDTFTMAEDGALSDVVLATDVDPGDTLVFSEVTPPTNGSLVLNADGTFDYTPFLNFNGSDTFTFRVNDGTVDSPIANVLITVTPVNDPPTITGESRTIAGVGATFNPVITDPDGETPIVILSVPPIGDVTPITVGGPDILIDAVPFDYLLPGDPVAGFTDSFVVTVRDAGGLEDSATFDITYEPPQPPVANEDTYVSGVQAQLTIPAARGVLVNDTDPDSGSISVVPDSFITSAGATVNIAADGSFVYTSPAGAPLTDDFFTYEVTDGGLSSFGNVTIELPRRIWFVDNTKGTGGDGSFTNPFDRLSLAESAAGFGDIIYVFLGDGTSSLQDFGITLRDDQSLIGSGFDLSVTSGTTTETLIAAGSQSPLIEHLDGVTITLGNNNFVAGLDVQNTAQHCLEGLYVDSGIIQDVTFVNCATDGVYFEEITGLWDLIDVNFDAYATGGDSGDGLRIFIGGESFGSTVNVQGGRFIGRGTAGTGESAIEADYWWGANTLSVDGVAFARSSGPTIHLDVRNAGAEANVNLTRSTLEDTEGEDIVGDVSSGGRLIFRTDTVTSNSLLGGDIVILGSDSGSELYTDIRRYDIYGADAFGEGETCFTIIRPTEVRVRESSCNRVAYEGIELRLGIAANPFIQVEILDNVLDNRFSHGISFLADGGFEGQTINGLVMNNRLTTSFGTTGILFENAISANTNLTVDSNDNAGGTISVSHNGSICSSFVANGGDLIDLNANPFGGGFFEVFDGASVDPIDIAVQDLNPGVSNIVMLPGISNFFPNSTGCPLPSFSFVGD